MARTNHRLRRQLKAPNGPIGQDLARRATRVANRSKQLVGSKRAVDTGRLRASIHQTPVQPDPTGLVVFVGSNLDYSLAVHEGSGSRFAPRSWRIAHARGRPIPPRRYLTEALPAARG